VGFLKAFTRAELAKILGTLLSLGAGKREKEYSSTPEKQKQRGTGRFLISDSVRTKVNQLRGGESVQQTRTP